MDAGGIRPPGAEENAMDNPTTRRAGSAKHRTQKLMMSPYYLDDVSFTLSDIRRARGEGDPSAVHCPPYANDRPIRGPGPPVVGERTHTGRSRIFT
jgi:hypothetical protein